MQTIRNLKSSIFNFLPSARAWAATRSWHWRLPILLLLGWNGIHQLGDSEYGGLFAGITFGSHEFGHLFFAFFGEFMAVLGGSLMQLLIPLAAGALLLFSGDFFGLSAAGAWLASSLLDLARYVGDARALELDLVGFGEDPQHDWAWILGQLGGLQYDTRIAGLLRGLATLVLFGSLLFGLWLCIRMMNRRPEAQPDA